MPLRNLTLDDLWTLKAMGNIALSPDGRRVAFEMQSADKETGEFRCVLFLLELDQQGNTLGEPRQLTSGTRRDTRPVWAPDSRRLLFLSNREGDTNQLWLIDTSGGEARKLTSMVRGISEAAWSPDGKWIAFTAPAAASDDVYVLTGRKTLDEASRKQREEEERFAPRSVTTIWYRLDGRGLFEKFTHLFVLPAPTDTADRIDPSTIRRLTSGSVDYSQPIWSPDSSEIAVLANLNENRDRSFVSDLWLIERETAAARCLTEGTLEIVTYCLSKCGQMYSTPLSVVVETSAH